MGYGVRFVVNDQVQQLGAKIVAVVYKTPEGVYFAQAAKDLSVEEKHELMEQFGWDEVR